MTAPKRTKTALLPRLLFAAIVLCTALATASPARAKLIGVSHYASLPDITAVIIAPSLTRSGGLLDADPAATFNLVASGVPLFPSFVGYFQGTYNLSWNGSGGNNTFSLFDELNNAQLMSGTILKAGEVAVDGTDSFDFVIRLSSIAPSLIAAGYGPYAGITLGRLNDDLYISDIGKLANPIPEPGTCLLFGAGIAGVLIWRRRSR